MCERPKMADLAKGLSASATSTASKELNGKRSTKAAGMVYVAPGLYLGNKQAAADHVQLESAGIVAICAVGAKTGSAPGMVYHHVSVEDDGVSSMSPFLDSACDFIHQQRQRGAVLVHCKGGINRSPCLVVAYLMKYEQLTLPEALELCSSARPAAR
eukprot:symbB.v1.2.033135.t1/scaffold4075.1/size45108/7